MRGNTIKFGLKLDKMFRVNEFKVPCYMQGRLALTVHIWNSRSAVNLITNITQGISRTRNSTHME